MTEIDWSKRKVWSAKAILAEKELLRSGFVPTGWGSAIEQEVRRRIRCSVAAYAYEFKHVSVMDDDAWDQLAQSINPKLGTCHPVLDEFFVEHFTPMTGMWIYQHPELDGIERVYKRWRG